MLARFLFHDHKILSNIDDNTVDAGPTEVNTLNLQTLLTSGFLT